MKRWGMHRWMEYWRTAGTKLGKQKCSWNNLREIKASDLMGRDRIYMGIMREKFKNLVETREYYAK